MALFGKSKSGFNAVIAVDPDRRVIHFFTSTEGSQTPNHETRPFKTRMYDAEFWQKFVGALTDFAGMFPAEATKDVTIVLPDTSEMTDNVAVPTLRRNKQDDALNVTLEGLYKNMNEMKVNNLITATNKQFTNYAVFALRNEIRTKIYELCSTLKLVPTAITFAWNTTANAAMALNSKLKGDTFLLLDVKPDLSRFVFVLKGKAIGRYDLDFGYDALHSSKLAAENMIIDHPEAELLVLNAKEKAKAKQQTGAPVQDENAAAMANAMEEDEELADDSIYAEEDAKNADVDDEDDVSFSDMQFSQTQNYATKVLPKKQPRKLPKNMLRPLPDSAEGYYYENFRIFVKWALNLIAENGKILNGTPLSAVYVNIPETYSSVFDKTNEEEKENGIAFRQLDFYVNEEIAANLELYGGFSTDQFNQHNNF